ncbi:MAG: vWA domain-containing protein [Candidatus Nanopelagicales bacterium]
MPSTIQPGSGGSAVRPGQAALAALGAPFGHRLHAAGVPVTPERMSRFAEAILLAEPRTIPEAYWLGRITLLTGHGQIAVFDRIFDEYFRGYLDLLDHTQSDAGNMSSPLTAGDRAPGSRPGESPSSAPSIMSATPGLDARSESDADEVSMLAAASQSERLAERDFSECTPEELALLRRLVEQLPLVPPTRRGRRLRRHARGDRLDIRATLRRAYRTGGDPVRQSHRKHAQRPRRVVLIADVSGSMEPYARIYLHLMRGAVRALGSEAFVFATRLTRLTRQLASGGPDFAYARVADATPDWAGGTRIGTALTRFLDEHGRRGIARGAIIVIVSDGWEIADPQEVGEAMSRLGRLAHHIIWVNPRSAAAEFEPLAGGMAAALPHVDTFLSGHSVQALQDLLAAIAGAGERRG